MSANSRGRDKYNKNRNILLLFSSAIKILPIRLRIKIFEFYRNTN